jgi:hypothetical protein
MKKLLGATIATVLFLASLACAQGLGTFGLPGLDSLTQNLTFNSYAQAGFQRVGSNIDLPISAEASVPGLLQIEGLSLSVQDANFWTGTLGASVKSGELLSLFASIGGSLNRPFVITGQIPVGLDSLGRQPTLEFDATKLDMWYAQGGVSLGPILLGLYGDHFGVAVGAPRRGSVPLDNQTLRADFLTTTLAPYIGFAVPAANTLFSVIYSPFAMSNTTVALRTSDRDVAQAKYKWNKPGNFISCSFQYNSTPTDSSSFGVWGNCAYMGVRGNAELSFQDANSGVSRQKQVTATMTKYIIQGGLMFGLNF